jgi:periplasmic divalent cation tolerance protein
MLLKNKDFLLVLSTCPNRDTALGIARALLDAGHAACVNVVPGVHSMYVWRGELQAEDEVLLLIKTPSAKFPALREALVAQHPYELPEVIAVGIEDGHHPYLEWLAEPRDPSRAGGP